jgi:hypothetical protein
MKDLKITPMNGGFVLHKTDLLMVLKINESSKRSSLVEIDI